MKEIILKKGKEQNLNRRHPWIFSGAIYKKDATLKDGDHVRVKDAYDNTCAVGHYASGSIAIRILEFQDTSIDEDYYYSKLQRAKDYRSSLALIDSKETNAYRLVHGEGDHLSGLIIDIYNMHAVVQCHSLGMYRDREHIAAALDRLYDQQLVSIYYKGASQNDRNKTVTQDGHYKGSETETTILENNVTFQVNWETGQKTGFFLDQRDNRQLVAEHSRGRSVLNCFCYTGGFSIYALNNGAGKVTSIDISQTATDLVLKNTQLNNIPVEEHDILTENVMKYLQSDDTNSYDVVIVDPPAFAKSQKKRHNAVQAYKRLNAMALKKVKSGGLLFTFSCSQVVGTELFNNTITAAAIETGRNIRVIKKLTQGPDHPINIYHPESSYLKGLLLYVE